MFIILIKVVDYLSQKIPTHVVYYSIVSNGMIYHGLQIYIAVVLIYKLTHIINNEITLCVLVS